MFRQEVRSAGASKLPGEFPKAEMTGIELIRTPRRPTLPIDRQEP
jgi:hypothetical protein